MLRLKKQQHITELFIPFTKTSKATGEKLEECWREEVSE